LKIISDYEHYVALNIPIEGTVATVDQLLASFWQRHYLAGYLLSTLEKVVVEEMGQEESEFRLDTIRALRELFWKHFIDDRYAVLCSFLPFGFCFAAL